MLEDLQEVVPKLLHTHLIIHVSFSNFRNNYRKELVESVMVVCITCQCSLAKHFFLQFSRVSATQSHGILLYYRSIVYYRQAA